jgi:DNA-binding transcriptional MerR regulator
MKAFNISKVKPILDKPSKNNKPKGSFVEQKHEISLDRIVKFSEFDITNLKELESQLLELGRAVSAILLADPDKYRDYYQSRVDLINESFWNGDRVVLE